MTKSISKVDVNYDVVIHRRSGEFDRREQTTQAGGKRDPYGRKILLDGWSFLLGISAGIIMVMMVFAISEMT